MQTTPNDTLAVQLGPVEGRQRCLRKVIGIGHGHALGEDLSQPESAHFLLHCLAYTFQL